MTRPTESLIERAARAYDFEAAFRGGGAPRAGAVPPPPPPPPPPPAPVMPVAWAEPETIAVAPEITVAAATEDRLRPEPVHMPADVAPADVALADVALADMAPAKPASEVMPTFAAIPAEFLARGGEDDFDAHDDWTPPPPGIALIDRVMLAEKGMLVPGAPIGALAEEFRLVKRQLLLTARALSQAQDSDAAEVRARTILVGSGKPGEGKTFCAINLAISLAAERDVEVLLVDADFAKPSIMATLGLTHTPEDSPGLLDILADPGLDPESCVIATDVPQLSLLPAGKHSHADTELLASARTAQVLEALLTADPSRIIVFDTPPALAASPASVLALLVGQVMLVVRADRTTESDVQEAVQLLDGCEQIHLVLNAVSYEPRRGRFGSYYGGGE